MRALTLAVLTAALSACGSVSPVLPVGHDTYMVESHGVAGNGTSAHHKVRALTAASAYCARQSLHVEVVDSKEVNPGWGRPPSAEIQFRCVPRA